MFALFRNQKHSTIWYYRFRYLVLEILGIHFPWRSPLVWRALYVRGSVGREAFCEPICNEINLLYELPVTIPFMSLLFCQHLWKVKLVSTQDSSK
jgi:hypothetical protein